MGRFEPEFAQRLAEEIRHTNRDRLHRSESHLRVCTPVEREGLARFLLLAADRPPVSGKGWERIRGMLESLAFDIFDMSADELGEPDPALVETFRSRLEAGVL